MIDPRSQPTQDDVPIVVRRFLVLNHQRKAKNSESGQIVVDLKFEAGVAVTVETSAPFIFNHSVSGKHIEDADFEKFLDRLENSIETFIKIKAYGRLRATIDYVLGQAMSARIDDPQIMRPKRD